MKAKALGRLLTAVLLSSAVVFVSITGKAQIPTPTANWVNIKDPKFAAMGDGKHDDTAAIQAAIDYAFAHGLNAVYCPAGTYKTSNTIWLDPPGNMRPFTFTGHISGTTLTVDVAPSVGVIQGDPGNGGGGTKLSGAGVAAGTEVVSGSGTTWTVNISQTISSEALTGSNLSQPPNSNFTMAFFGDPQAGGIAGCRLQYTTNNLIAFLMGPGQGMRVSDIVVLGPTTSYRGNLPSSGVGIGTSGGNAGSTRNLIENTYVDSFYALYKTEANGACCLNDSNTLRKVFGNNGYYGIAILGTQSYANNISDAVISSTTVSIYNPLSRPVKITGGNLSATSGQASSFGLSAVSAFTKTGTGNGYNYGFTATIASPDQYIPNVYNSYTIVTSHFGVVPLTMTAWNAGTSVGTFQILPAWVWSNYGILDLTVNTDIQAEVAAATTIYAAERVTVVSGPGVSFDGAHIENASACTTFFDTTEGISGAFTSEAKNPYFDYNLGSLTGTAHNYCQRTFPFINSNRGSITLDGGEYGGGSGFFAWYPVLIDADPSTNVYGSRLSGAWFTLRINDNGGASYAQTNPTGVFETEARGFGIWDKDYFFPAEWTGYTVAGTAVLQGELRTPYCGYEPCPWTTPDINPGLYSLVSGALGALGTYPPIACRTMFKSVDWNSGALSHLFLRSASCPGYSWGQNLTNALVGETVTWSYKGQSSVLYLDANTLSWMFPGLVITITDANGTNSYTVTGVFSDLGYISVMNVVLSGYLGSPGPMAGNKTTVYSCSSSCTIGQAPFAWTAY